MLCHHNHHNLHNHHNHPDLPLKGSDQVRNWLLVIVNNNANDKRTITIINKNKNFPHRKAAAASSVGGCSEKQRRGIASKMIGGEYLKVWNHIYKSAFKLNTAYCNCAFEIWYTSSWSFWLAGCLGFLNKRLFWPWIQVFFESISKYSIFQAEIVRKKGKNLLSDPIFNKVKPGFKI